MKQNSIVITTLYSEEKIDALMQKRDGGIKLLTQKSARSLGERNLPALTGDSLVPYISEIKSSYERLSSEILQHLQPEAHFPEGKLDITRGREKEANLQWAIEQKEEKTKQEEEHLGKFNPKSMIRWVRRVFMLLGSLMFAEVLYNTKAFQVIGENLLFSFLLSLFASIGVLLFGDLTAMLYKMQPTRLRRLVVVALSFLIVGCLFYGLAILRADYLAAHGRTVNPLIFISINLFFFIVSVLVSYFFLPSWAEIKEYMHLMKIYHPLQESKRVLDSLKSEQEQLKDALNEMTKARVRCLHYAQYVNHTIDKMYHEAIGLFIRINLMYRTDRKTPDCFALELPKPDLGNVDFKSLNNNQSN